MTETVCRICLRTYKVQNRTFSVLDKHENQTLADLFQQTTRYKIEADEPQFFCSDCRLHLIISARFIQTCKTTQEKLKNFGNLPQQGLASDQKQVIVYYEEEIAADSIEPDDHFDQNFDSDDLNESGEHSVLEAREAHDDTNEPNSQGSDLNTCTNDIEEILIKEPIRDCKSNVISDLNNSNDVIAESTVPSIHDPNAVVSINSKIIDNRNESNLKSLVVCIKPIEDGYFCDLCKENSCLYESRSELEKHKISHSKKSKELPIAKRKSIETEGVKTPDHSDTHETNGCHSDLNDTKNECDDVAVEKQNDSADSPRPLKSKFTCDFCNKSFMYKWNLQRHIQCHMEKTQCPYCDNLFVTQNHKDSCSLNPKNMQNSEDTALNIKCEKCGPASRVFKTHELFRHHLRDVHPQDKTSRCQHCLKFFHPDWVRIHEQICQSSPYKVKTNKKLESKFTCDFCNKSFMHKWNLQRHMQCHMEKTQCPYCDKLCVMDQHKAFCSFNPKSMKNSEDVALDIKCEKCGPASRVFKTHELFRHHLRDVHPQDKTSKCQFCLKLFHPDWVKIHEQICRSSPYKVKTKKKLPAENQNNSADSPKPLENKSTCDVCNKSFMEWNLQRHMQSHKRPKERVRIRNTENRNKMAMCTYCGKILHRRYLETHIASMHTDTKQRLFCDLCPNKSFNDRSHLFEHMKTVHLKIRKVCSVCGASYRLRSSLRDHQRKIHTDLFPYLTCPHCPFKTPYVNNMRCHRKRHLGQAGKNYSCESCGKMFTTNFSLQAHILSHSNQLNSTCDVCGCGFKSDFYLKRHMKRIHSGGNGKNYECPVCQKLFTKNQDNRSHIEKHHPEYQLPPPGTVLKKNPGRIFFRPILPITVL